MATSHRTIPASTHRTMTAIDCLLSDFGAKNKHTLYTACSMPGCQMMCDDLQVCSGCYTANYCSRICQERHWQLGHEHECLTEDMDAERAQYQQTLFQLVYQRWNGALRPSRRGVYVLHERDAMEGRKPVLVTVGPVQRKQMATTSLNAFDALEYGQYLLQIDYESCDVVRCWTIDTRATKADRQTTRVIKLDPEGGSVVEERLLHALRLPGSNKTMVLRQSVKKREYK